MNIGIAGLGLIGGSIAKAVQTRTDHVVFGFDISKEVTEAAIKEGAIDGVLDEAALEGCDLVIVALYPKDAVEFVTQHAQHIRTDAVVVDCCGVKRFVCNSMSEAARSRGFVFVGGHPMAGTERWGFTASRENLFAGASMIITPDETVPRWALQRVSDVFLEIGFGRMQYSTPEEHDFIISYTSQLAHVVSSAYIDTDSADRTIGFSAGSFRDMTRVAWLNEAMWTELFLENADYLANEVDELIARLGVFSKALRTQDKDTMLCLLKRSREKKEQIDIKQGRS